MPRRLSIAFIQSSECDWPETVKATAIEIIKLSADLQLKKHALAELHMMDAAKIDLAQEVAQIHQSLANMYRNLSKELVYHLSRTNH